MTTGSYVSQLSRSGLLKISQVIVCIPLESVAPQIRTQICNPQQRLHNRKYVG